MKRVLSVVLALVLLLTGCGVKPETQTENTKAAVTSTEIQTQSTDAETVTPTVLNEISYTGLDDNVLLRQIEDQVYADAVCAIDSTEYVVENVQAVFISKEYIDEVAFNSQANIYFGYTMDELDALFHGDRYIFTLGEDGKTTVQRLEVIENTTTETILKNVAIGTGVILVCVTVSCVTAGAAPAVSVIFAASAKSAGVMALSSGIFGAVSAGIVRGVKTGDMNEALEAAAVAGSEKFMWGAISGAIKGGGKTAFALKAATKGGLSMREVALIQRESKLPMDIISQFHSMEEYDVYRQAGLKTLMVNGETALVQSVDLNYMSELSDGTKVSNLERMQRGMAPIDPATGNAYELHHIGQTEKSTLAMLTQEQHRGKGIMTVLHENLKKSVVSHGVEWLKKTNNFWKYLGNIYAAGGIA